MTVGRENIRKKKVMESQLKQSMNSAARNKQANSSKMVPASLSKERQNKEIVRHHKVSPSIDDFKAQQEIERETDYQ